VSLLTLSGTLWLSKCVCVFGLRTTGCPQETR
jgi:hypothetical protein